MSAPAIATPALSSTNLDTVERPNRFWARYRDRVSTLSQDRTTESLASKARPVMRDIAWEPCLVEPASSPELERRYAEVTGRPGGLMKFINGSGWLSEAVIRLSVELRDRVHLDATLGDEVGLVVSQESSCRYCFGAQRLILRSIGIPERRIARLEQDLLTGDFAVPERAALRFARRLARSSPPVSRADLEVLRQSGFSDAEVSELVGLVAVCVFFNRLATLLALPPEPLERLPISWLARASGWLPTPPRRRRRTRPVAPSPEEMSGPFSRTVAPLQGLPLARKLEITLDEVWAADAISDRCPPLVFAVVARALDCPELEHEATRLLVERDLPGQEVERVLTHLSSPALTDLERDLVSLARETVWGQPAQIQPKLHRLKDRLTREQLLEFAGMAALANAVCRLSVLGCEVA